MAGLMMPLTHMAGEMDWGDKNVAGCDRYTMRPGDTYVLCLTWDDARRTFRAAVRWGPHREHHDRGTRAHSLSYKPSPLIPQRKGHDGPVRR